MSQFHTRDIDGGDMRHTKNDTGPLKRVQKPPNRYNYNEFRPDPTSQCTRATLGIADDLGTARLRQGVSDMVNVANNH